MFTEKETEESVAKVKEIREDIYTLIEKYGVRLTKEEPEVTKAIKVIEKFEKSTPYIFVFSFLYADIGRIYLMVNDFKTAAKYAKGSLYLNKENEDKNGMASAYGLLCDIAVSINDFSSAVTFSELRSEAFGTRKDEFNSSAVVLDQMNEKQKNGELPPFNGSLDLNKNIGLPAHFNALFKGTEEELKKEIATRKLMVMMGVSRQEALEYVKEAEKMVGS